MFKDVILYLFAGVLLISCEGKAYKPNHLRKLTDEELLEYAKAKEKYPMNNVVYKNHQGEVVDIDSIMKMPCLIRNFTWTHYVNEKNEIEEIVIKEATQEDLEARAKFTMQLNAQEEYSLIDIDCSKLSEILQKVYESDQGTRQEGGIDAEIDRQNLITVVSIIEKCGMPTLEIISEKEMTAVWLVLQHTDHLTRVKYLPYIEKAVENGDLEKRQLALTMDRILSGEGKPQLYGSQILPGCEPGTWEYLPIKDPEYVNKRRAEVGLGPIQEYLDNWSIEFNVEQKE